MWKSRHVVSQPQHRSLCLGSLDSHTQDSLTLVFFLTQHAESKGRRMFSLCKREKCPRGMHIARIIPQTDSSVGVLAVLVEDRW